jgi:hypothetical protein
VKAKVYIETIVISYLTVRPNRDVVIAGHQKITRDWWQTCRERFDVVASQLVVREASAGDSRAAQERLEKLATLTLLEVTEEAVSLAQELVSTGAMPEKAAEDALHISP